MVLKTYDEIKKFIEELGGELLSENYEKNSTPLILKCPKCGQEFERCFSNIQQRLSIECKPCSYKTRAEAKIKKKQKEVEEYINSLGGKLINYNGARNDLTLLCPRCDSEFTKTLSGIKNSGIIVCKSCSKEDAVKETRTDIDFIRNFIENLGGELVSETYKRAYGNLLIKCNKCGKTYKRTWKYIKEKENVTCPLCSDSRSLGEDKIINILTKHDIEFSKEKTFEDCVDKGRLRYDFYLPKANVCIEFDGKQHFYPHNDFGGTETFEDRIKKDKIKTDYCIKNNIKLIRISYKQFSKIESILIENKIIPSQAS